MVAGMMESINLSTSFSKHFIATDVSTSGACHSHKFYAAFPGTSTMMENLKWCGMTVWDSEVLKMSWNMSASSAAQALRSHSAACPALLLFSQLNCYRDL